jgi:hypothetical protein
MLWQQEQLLEQPLQQLAEILEQEQQLQQLQHQKHQQFARLYMDHAMPWQGKQM